jgi:hypothetical protein
LRSNGEEDGHPANKAHNQITKIKSAQPRESHLASTIQPGLLGAAAPSNNNLLYCSAIARATDERITGGRTQ